MSESDIRVILAALARVETKVEAIQADNTRGEMIHQDHERRIRSIEQFKWVLAGAVVASGGLGAALTKAFGI